MILEKNGNLLNAPEDIIVHQVNCQGVMGSGIAKQIKEAWPEVYNKYQVWTEYAVDDTSKLLGCTQLVQINDRKYVVNLFSQDNYGKDGKRYTNYEALYEGLDRIKRTAMEAGLSVAIPRKMGSDRGGADWGIVCKMIEVIFNDYQVTIYNFGGN